MRRMTGHWHVRHNFSTGRLHVAHPLNSHELITPIIRLRLGSRDPRCGRFRSHMTQEFVTRHLARHLRIMPDFAGHLSLHRQISGLMLAIRLRS
jgi:hypothetical protein